MSVTDTSTKPFQDYPFSWIQRQCMNVVKCGPIPKHMAFIMDGSRRFAKQEGIRKVDSWKLGYKKFQQISEICMFLGVREVTAFTLSIDNINRRSAEEIEGLMSVLREAVQEMTEPGCIKYLCERGVAVRFPGNLALLPPDIQDLAKRAEEATKHNSRGVLNVCLAYTSRDEICRGVRKICQRIEDESLEPNDIDEQLLNDVLDITTDVDILIRTSGEVRLSDFLMWQSTYSQLIFIKTLWPSLSFWGILWEVLDYQIRSSKGPYIDCKQ